MQNDLLRRIFTHSHTEKQYLSKRKICYPVELSTVNKFECKKSFQNTSFKKESVQELLFLLQLKYSKIGFSSYHKPHKMLLNPKDIVIFRHLAVVSTN